MKKLMFIFMMLCVSIGMVSATPYFSITSIDDWETPVASGQIRPMSPVQWEDYMGQWQAHFDPDDGEPYPTDTQFVTPELYVWEGGGGGVYEEPGLVMAWGNDNLPQGSYASAWIYDYPLDPDLSNCTITLTVMPPQFDLNGNQINNVSFGMKDINGNIRSWHWTCGPGGLPWNVLTTITINTAMTGGGAAIPAATGYVSHPAFDITKVLSFIVDENGKWVGGAAPVPPPGQFIPRPWNLWAGLMVTPNPTNGGIIAGINIDVHQDINDPTIKVNDFHIEGRIESGLPLGAPGGGGWSNPPVLVTHIDDLFNAFTYTIVPDYSDPQENWYIIKADWFNPTPDPIPFCTILHLGLEFEVTCHNVIIDVVGWWTSDGKKVQGGANGGYIPIPGFNVQDNIGQAGGQQSMRLQSGDADGEPEPGEISMEILQFQLAGVEPRMLHELLGPEPFKKLNTEHMSEQAQLPWKNVLHNGVPISPANPGYIPPDSFFDVFFEVDVEGGPLVLNAGNFLIAREQIQFTNNANQQEMRWVWEIHEAHDNTASDLGDAPDSTNNFNILMWTYPSGMQANFPTVYQSPGVPPHGPIHLQPLVDSYLGQAVTLEKEADIMADQDPTNNIVPPNNAADLDFADDGLLGLPLKLPNCKQTQFQYIVTNNVVGTNKYLNAWADFNRDGDWDDVHICTLPDGTQVNVPEHIVMDQDLTTLPLGVNTVTSPLFYCWHPTTTTPDNPEPIWVRLTLAESKWIGSGGPGIIGTGGSGPAAGYQYGETEDYYFVPVVPPDCACADLTGDGFVDINDFACLAAKWLQTCP